MSINPARLTASSAYRVTGEVVCFEQGFDTALDTEAWHDGSSGGGALVRNATTSALSVSVGTASAAVARVRSHARPKAAMGRSRTTIIVASAAAVTSQRKRFGLFDEGNGYFFELNGETLSVVRRTNVSGSVVDTAIANANWTGSNGASTYRDPSKTHVWEIREIWPNGDASFFVDGQLVHVLSTKGSVIGPSGRTARLPVTVECENLATTSAGSVELVSATVVIETAPVSVRTFSASAVNATVGTSDTALLCLRPRATFGGAANWGELLCDMLTATCKPSVAGESTSFKIIVGATITGGSWTSPDAASIAESNATASSYTGGITAVEIVTDAGLALSEVKEAVRTLRLRGDGTTPDTLVIAAAAESGTADVRMALSWKEIR